VQSGLGTSTPPALLAGGGTLPVLTS